MQRRFAMLGTLFMVVSGWSLLVADSADPGLCFTVDQVYSYASTCQHADQGNVSVRIDENGTAFSVASGRAVFEKIDVTKAFLETKGYCSAEAPSCTATAHQVSRTPTASSVGKGGL